SLSSGPRKKKKKIHRATLLLHIYSFLLFISPFSFADLYSAAGCTIQDMQQLKIKRLMFAAALSVRLAPGGHHSRLYS
ncbi:hypothetical protein B0H13DRAFT_2117896, partial [Mycena leptocephala]